MNMKRNFTILLTDDNKEFTQNLCDILELKGYSVLTAIDGFQALDIIKASPVDVILMDIKMPVMNGVETYKKIKKITPDTPVIMLTAYIMEELIQESLKEGAFACLKKPIDFDELFATIERAVPNGSMILVIDDDEHLCQNLLTVLTQKGYQVSVAMDSNSAIEKVRTSVYDILLLDMKLPPLNGLETYLKIRRLCPKIVVVIIAGILPEMDKIIEMAGKSGMYALLEKPINIDNLLSILEQIEIPKRKNETENPE
jgi:two-component system response regulator HydG